MKALAAGKHVLLEKPSANRAEETRQMFDLASRKGLVLLEAFHNRFVPFRFADTALNFHLFRFHPALQRFKEIVASGELGALKSMQVSMAMPDVLFQPDDIRFTHALGGGAVMDMGGTLPCLHSARFSGLKLCGSVYPQLHMLLGREPERSALCYARAPSTAR
jgi:hypothetical protein